VAAISSSLDKIIAQAEQLSPEDRLRLIQRVAETLLPAQKVVRPRRLVYGELSGPNLSTEDDFTTVEWRPSDREVLIC
jgi:hypothetical protein